MGTKDQDINARIIEQAISMGASIAGIVNVAALKKSPSHVLFEKLDRFDGVSTRDYRSAPSGQVVWPDNFASVIVVGIQHPEIKPELDWWQYEYSGGTSGNRILIDISSRLSEWLETEKGYKTQKLPYHIEKGGIFLKDAAVLAGLGCIGKNNLLISPDYGPRIRLRAILVGAALPATGAIIFDPCNACDMPCRKACPQGAFQDIIYHETEFGLNALPGRSGVYDRVLCNRKLAADIDNFEIIGIDEPGRPGKVVKYCRRCEFACPVGKE